MINPLFKKLVNNYAFGEFKTAVTYTGKGKSLIDPKPETVKELQGIQKDKYMIIRRGKFVGWGEM